jgi:Lrp/AsnC family leucine-responsive transcriptional regulator
MLTKPLDPIDLKILAALQANSGISNVDLAAKIGISPSPCLRRVKTLEREGFISGYRAVVSRQAVGCYLVTGGLDYVLDVVATNLETYSELTITRLIRLPGVKEIRSSFVLKEVGGQKPLPLEHLGPQRKTRPVTSGR